MLIVTIDQMRQWGWTIDKIMESMNSIDKESYPMMGEWDYLAWQEVVENNLAECGVLFDEEKGKSIGYWSYFVPVKKLYDKIYQGRHLHGDIKVSNISPMKDKGEYNIHITSFVLRPSFRRLRYFKLLIQSMIDSFVVAHKKGKIIKEIITINVSEEGYSMALSFGMRKMRERENGGYVFVLNPSSPDHNPRIARPYYKELE